MRIGLTAVVILMTGSRAQAEFKVLEAGPEVTVCISGQDPRLIPGSLALSQVLASRMFDGIGVTIKWSSGLLNCPAQGIRIDMSYHTPATLQPRALAYALPFEGTHVRIFYDRIVQGHDKSQVSAVLAHVLAHEITHILQGLSRHAETGLMKANWNRLDFSAMGVHPLQFEDVDIEWIYRGLSARPAAPAIQPDRDALAVVK